MELLCIIPARGGSKGIPRKNLQLLAGKPLLAHTIEQAIAARTVSRVVVSTNDEEIGNVAREFGAEVVWRPEALSGDTASSESALRHCVEYLQAEEGYQPDVVLFLQCTSPLRRRNDIDDAIGQMLVDEADSLVSVVPVVVWLWRIQDGHPVSFNYDYHRRLRRQDRPQEFNENGSLYAFKPWVLLQHNNRLGGKITLYQMDEWSNLDIESMADLKLAELVLQTLGPTAE